MNLVVVHLRKFRVFALKNANFINERVNGLTDEKMILTPFGIVKVLWQTNHTPQGVYASRNRRRSRAFPRLREILDELSRDYFSPIFKS